MTDSNATIKSGMEATIALLREELAVTNRGIVALNLELEKKMQELELLNEDLKSFAYSISHDLRQPLRAIDGFSAIIEEQFTGNFDEQGQFYFSRIRQNIARMDAMIEGLLTLSRVTRQEISRENVALDVIAETLLAELKEEDPQRQVQVDIESGINAFADRQLMEQAMQNLLSNAWKYSARRPDACISFNRKQADKETIFVVKDNGAGFDMAFADKLFNVFQRLHSQEEFRGTGVGLATTQRIIQRHGGRIWAESEPGQGASFMFTLPDTSSFE